MWSWLSHLDPNVLIGVVVAIGGFVYHQFSPATQAKIQADISSAQRAALAVADQAMSGLTLAAAATGKTRAQLEAQLWAAARIQLGHIGLDTDNLPPALTQAVEALIAKYTAQYK